MKREQVTDTGRALLVLLFAYTTASKFLDYHRFIFQLQMSPVAMVRYAAPLLGWLVPLAESMVAAGLLTNRYKRWSLYGAVALLLLFECYISALLLSGLPLPCSCGGVIAKLDWKGHLVFNGAFILIGLIALLRLKKYKRPPGPGGLNALSRA